MFRRRSRPRRRRRLRRLTLLGLVTGGVVAYRRRRLAENERAVWPAGPPGTSPQSP